MSWFLSKVYTTLRGANSSRSTSSSVATNRSLSDAEIDSLDLNCTVSTGNNHRYSYLSYSSADKEGSSCGGWSRPESTAGSIHDSEGPDGLILRLYGEDYILGENGECRPVHRETESKRLSTISVSCSNQNNENEKLCYGTPETPTDPQYEWSDEKADWITPLGFGRSRQSKRRSVRPRSENVDEMWLRVVKSVNASFDSDEVDIQEHIDNIDNTYEHPQEKQKEIKSDFAKEEHNIDNKTIVTMETSITNSDTDERQEDHQPINSEKKSNLTGENLNENDLNQEEETNTTFIENTDNLFDYETISEMKEKEIDNFFVDEDPKSDDEDEFRSSLVGTSNILNEIFQHFGLPADEVNTEDYEQVELPVAHDHTIDALLARSAEDARAKEELVYCGNDHLEQPIVSAFARNGSYVSMKDCLQTDVGLLDELESIFSDRQSSLFNEEESSKEYDDVDALRKSIEDIVSALDKSTNSEVQLKRLRQSLKKLNNFETKSIKQNKHITNDSSSVTKATDRDEKSKPIHGVFGNLAKEQDHYSHEMHSSGKNTSTYSDNKGNWDYSFNLPGLGYDQPIEHDSIAYAVTNNIFSAASVELNKKQIEPANTHSIPFTESIKSVRCSDQHDTRVRRSNALEIWSEQAAINNKNIEASGGCGEPEKIIEATTGLPQKCCDKELPEKDDWNYDFDHGITWAGNGTSDILDMVKVQSEFNPCKIDRRYIKPDIKLAIKPDQATSSGKDIIKEDIKNSEYLSTKLHASKGRGVGRFFASQLGYNKVRVNDDGLTFSDFNMGCISVYCKSKSQENEHSEDDYSNSNGHKQLVRDEEIGKFGFENSVLDNEIDRSIPDDELESRIALDDSRFGVSLKNDRNKNGINYTLPEIQKVSQVESYKLGTDLTNDSTLSVDVFETEKADKDDLDSGLECQDEARDEERVRLSLNHTDDDSESFSTEHTFNSSTNSGEAHSMINSLELLTDRQEKSSEEIKDSCTINSKETSIDYYEKTSSDLDSDSFWQEPFEFCSGNSHQSSPSPTDHGKLAQSTTEILKLKLTTLNDSIFDIFENEGHKMGNSNTYEQRSSFEEDSGEHGKDSKHGFWEVNGIKARRSGAFSTKRGADRTSQFYVPLDTSFEEEAISAQTAGVLNFAPFENSSTDEYILQDTNREGSHGRLEQDDSHSDCTSASSFSFGIARIFNEETQTIDKQELVDTHLQVDNKLDRTDDVERLESASVSAIESQERRNSVSSDSITTEGSSDHSLDLISQSNYRSFTNIKQWKSADGLIFRLHAGSDEQTIVPADDEDRDGEESVIDIENDNHNDHKTIDCNMYEYEGHPMIHDKVNNNCKRIEDVLKRQPEVVIENCKRTEDIVTQSTMDTEYIGTDKPTEIRNLEEDWQRNRKLREEKREERRKREQALQDKVNWVREEIKIMKQLDKKLIDQFFELRSVIHQMTYAKNRPIRDLNISDLDEEDAFYEDAEIVEFDSQATPAHEEYIPAFRGRTVSMMTPPCERRLKPGWKLNRRMPSFTTEDDVQLELLML